MMTRVRKFAGIFRQLNQSMPPEPVLVKPLELKPEDHEVFNGVRVPRFVPAEIVGDGHDGLRHVAPEVLIAAHRQTIQMILSSFVGTRAIPEFDRRMTEIIGRFAANVSTLPASRQGHHAGPGGLFAHTLDVAHKAIVMSSGYNLTFDSPAELRGDNNLAWQLVVFFSALLHDIGKVQSLGRVVARTVYVSDAEGTERGGMAPVTPIYWRPQVCTFARWAEVFKVDTYILDHAPPQKGARHETFAARYLERIIPSEFLGFIYESHRNVVRQFEDFIDNPISASTAELFTLIKDADALSTIENTNPQTTPGATTITGLAVRRLKEFAEQQTWNMPNSAFIRAHIPLQGQDRTHLIQASFFVATPENVDVFMKYFETKDGQSIPTLYESARKGGVREVVFAALERSGLFLRTTPILLEQIAPDDQPDDIPASLAHVLYTPIPVEGIKDAKAIQREVPVIALGSSIRSVETKSMPTLSFWGPPNQAYVSSIPVRFDDPETMAPEDPAQENDETRETIETFAAEAKKKSRRQRFTPESLSTMNSVTMSTDIGPFKIRHDNAPPPPAAAAPVATAVAEGQGGAPAAASDDQTNPSEAQGDLSPVTEEQSDRQAEDAPASAPSSDNPTDTDLWVQAWTAGASNNAAVMAALYLFMLAQGKSRQRKDRYVLDIDCLDAPVRDELKAEVHVRKLNMERFVVWPRGGHFLPLALKEVAERQNNGKFLMLRGDASALVDQLTGRAG